MSQANVDTSTLIGLLGDWRNAASGPSYLALSDRIRLLIIDGRIGAEARLPAERDLASSLDVSRTMVTAAYRELRESGYIESLRGSGSVATLPRRVEDADEGGSAGIVDLTKASTPAAPGLEDYVLAAAERLRGMARTSGYDLRGIAPLRTAVAERYTARGLPTEPDEIVITLGAQHALALVLGVAAAPGDRALVELPTYPHAHDALARAGARIAAVPVTDAGWGAAGIERAFVGSAPSIAYLMPDFHNPTGLSMSAPQRERLAALAATAGTTVIVDESTAELDIDRRERYMPFAAYASASEDARVITIGSVAKTVWGGLRIGWIRAERDVLAAILASRSVVDLGAPVLDQLVVVEAIADYDRILEFRRRQLEAGRDHLLEAIAARLPDWRAIRPRGGVAVWADIGAPLSSQLSFGARASGVLLPPGSRFGSDAALERHVRLPLAHAPATIDRAVDAVESAWEALLRSPVPQSSALAEIV